MAQQDDELIQAQAELRDFKRAVLALRQELENAHAEADARLRKSVAVSKAENAQLESTVVALREELEEAGQKIASCGPRVRPCGSVSREDKTDQG